MKSFAKEHPVLVLTNMAFMSIMPINEILLPHLYGKLLDAMQNKKTIIKYLVSVICILTIVQIGYSLGDWHDTLLNPTFQSYIRQSMLNKIMEKYENNYEDLTVGDIITKLVKAPFILMQWFISLKDYIIPYLLVFISASIYFITYDVVLGVSLIVTMIMMGILLISSPMKCSQETIELSRVYHELHEEIDDILRNLLSVYGGNQKNFELNRVLEIDKQYKKSFSNTMTCILKYKVMAIPVIVTFFSIFIIRSNYLIHQNKMKTSNFVSLFMMLLYMVGSLSWTVDIMRNIIFDWGAIKETERILELKDLPTNTLLNSHDSRLQIPFNGIGLYNVSFTYPGSKDPILNNFSMYFNPGEKVVLLGDIGSGKSTVLKLLMRFYLPDQGDIFINGEWYSNLTTYQIRKQIGYIPQTPVLFNRSVYDNIKYGNVKITNDQIDHLFHEYNIYHEFTNLENGLETPIGKNGSKLSGGQRQLIWCIRVMLSNPDIILMDEFTSAMDQKTKDIIIKMLNVMIKGKTVIMVTHDDYLLRIADRRIYIKNGQILSR